MAARLLVSYAVAMRSAEVVLGLLHAVFRSLGDASVCGGFDGERKGDQIGAIRHPACLLRSAFTVVERDVRVEVTAGSLVRGRGVDVAICDDVLHRRPGPAR